MALILILEDEGLLRWSLEQRLSKAGHDVLSAEDLAQASEHLRQHQPDVALLDLSLPDGHGLDFFERNLDRLEGTVVIVVTAVGQVEDAVRAMKLGALDFLTKPVDHGELLRLVERSMSVRSDHLEAQAARTTRERELGMEVVAESPGFRRVLELAGEVAKSGVMSVLVLGESGSGKNVVARYIHALSDRRSRPLLEVSCAAIPDELLESELFGHEKGAFTDAKSMKQGSFELAGGGTLVLDEVGDLKLGLQAKLLHALDERRFRRVGGTRELIVDARVIALTNRDLQGMVQSSAFRTDLYFRLSVFPITVPPLRERREDILPLARRFLEDLQPKFNRRIDGFTREAENLLMAWNWPGNVRELRNVIERAMIMERGPLLSPSSLITDGVSTPQTAHGDHIADFGDRIVPLEELEREMVRRALEVTGGNQTRAAELLGISRDQLRYRVKKFA